jgi:hypothetical protein
VAAQEVLRESVQSGYRGRRRLKKFGSPVKLDYQTCRLCLKHCSTYNDPASLDNDAILFKHLKQFGCTPLHSWMRSMECIIVAAEIKLMADTGIGQKEARRSIQQRFASTEGKGLRIYFPDPKGGNTNSGPTARRFFRNAELTSKIIGCPKESVNF